MNISKLKTLFVAIAAAASIPGAMAANGNPNTNGLPAPHAFVNNLYPFICNPFPAGTSVDGFSGYINIAGQRGLVIDLQTSVPETNPFGNSTAGTFTLPNVPFVLANGHNRFTGLSFNLQGYCNDDGCSGPWVFVDAYDQQGNQLFGANVVCSSNFPAYGGGSCVDVGSDASTFITQSFSATSFGFPAKGVSLADVTIQLFPGCDGPHDTRLTNVTINGQHSALQQPRTIYNFCPIGFFDPRPVQCAFPYTAN